MRLDREPREIVPFEDSFRGFATRLREHADFARNNRIATRLDLTRNQVPVPLEFLDQEGISRIGLGDISVKYEVRKQREIKPTSMKDEPEERIIIQLVPPGVEPLPEQPEPPETNQDRHAENLRLHKSPIKVIKSIFDRKRHKRH